MKTQQLTVGGRTKQDWRAALAAAGVVLNPHAEALLADPRWQPAPTPTPLTLVGLTVAELGLPQATLPGLFAAAAARGWQPAPLEAALALRLAWLHQPASTNRDLSRHEAPQGAITVISPLLAPGDDDWPKGLYLRNVGGQLWLRGYRCDDQYAFPAATWIAFAQA